MKTARVLVAALAFLAALAHAQDAKVLNIYNWSDYIADDTIRNFEKETGIKVHYDNYDANEILHAKLVAGGSSRSRRSIPATSSWSTGCGATSRSASTCPG